MLAVRVAFLFALCLGSLAAVQEMSVDCSNLPVYLTTDNGLLLTSEDGRLLLADRGVRQCELKMGNVRLPLPHQFVA